MRYTMPLGLHHLIGGDHYAPMPENADPRRADWSAIYYHRADAAASASTARRRGSNAVDQYRSPLREQWDDAGHCPRELLLWFHRLPWDHRLASGRTLWEEHRTRVPPRGRGGRAALESRWEALEGKVDGGALPGGVGEAAPARRRTRRPGATSASATSRGVGRAGRP